MARMWPKALITSLLERNPENRPHSWGFIIQQLQRIRLCGNSDTPPTHTHTRARARTHTSPLLSALCPLPSASPLCLLTSALPPLPSALSPLLSALSPLPSASPLCPLNSQIASLLSVFSPLPSHLCPLLSALSPLLSALSPRPLTPSHVIPCCALGAAHSIIIIDSSLTGHFLRISQLQCHAPRTRRGVSMLLVCPSMVDAESYGLVL